MSDNTTRQPGDILYTAGSSVPAHMSMPLNCSQLKDIMQKYFYVGSSVHSIQRLVSMETHLPPPPSSTNTPPLISEDLD